jgi:hypothetical protein
MQLQSASPRAVEPAAPARRAGRPALDLQASGIALVVLLAAAWLTALPYLLVRLGLPGLVPIDRVDAPHAFLGLAAVGLLTVKVVDLVRHRAAVRAWRMPPWQTWLSRALAYLYGAVVLTGLLLLIPWPAVLRTDLVELHLLTATWALLATIPHLVVHLRGRLHGLRVSPRLAGGLLAAALPALLLASFPLALSPLAQLGAGGSFQPVGPPGAWMFRLLRLADGSLLAAGQGVYRSADGGRTWTAEPAGDALVFAVTQLPDGELLLGTSDGLLRAAGPAGPYVPVAVPSPPVTAIHADPSAPSSIWIGGHGVWASTDGGADWAPDVKGLVAQGTVWSLGSHGGLLTAGMTTGVYTQSSPSAPWVRTLALDQVVSIDEGSGALWASSMGGGLAVLRGGAWTHSDSGLATHHADAIHVTSYTDLGSGRSLATLMHGGLAESLDGGRSWAPLTAGFSSGPVWAALPLGKRLLLATDTGLLVYTWPPRS